MDFRSLGLFYNFECFLIFSLRNQQGAVCVMRGRPSQGASAVLKGALLAPLQFLHAQSCLVAICLHCGPSAPVVLAGHLRSPDLLEVAGLPTLVEGRFSRALEPEDDEIR